MHEETFLLGSIYGPNIDSPNFYNDLFRRINETNVDRKIIAGDINTVLDASVDQSDNRLHKNSNAAAAVRNSLEYLDLSDVWREMKDNEPGYTWRRHFPYSLAERLDYLFVSSSLM